MLKKKLGIFIWCNNSNFCKKLKLKQNLKCDKLKYWQHKWYWKPKLFKKKTLNRTKLKYDPSNCNKTTKIVNSKIPDRPKMGTLIPDCCDQMIAQTSNSLADQIRAKTARNRLTTRWKFFFYIILGGTDKARHLAKIKK